MTELVSACSAPGLGLCQRWWFEADFVVVMADAVVGAISGELLLAQAYRKTPGNP